MRNLFDSWYSGMEFSENADARSQRWASIQSVAKNPNSTTLEVLTRLAFRTKLKPYVTEAGQVRTQLAEGGSALQDEEAALIAAVVLAQILEEKDAIAAKASAFISNAACAGLRGLEQPMDLIGMASNAQVYFAETARRRPSLEQSKLVNSQLDIASSLDALEEVTSATVRAAFEAAISATNKALNAMASRQRSFETAAQNYVRVQDEELDILWWLQGGQCTLFGLPFSEVKPELRPVVFAVELAALTKVLPGPTALPSLLVRAGVDNSVRLSIPAAVQVIPKEWLDHVLPEHLTGKVSTTTTPILEALRRRQEVEGEDTWASSWSSVTGINPDTTLTALQLCEALYRELLQVTLG